ncbi:DNA adenine methylase [Seminibacterium arietis]|uniref:site-specific DNA-methyltransferase (adenine-specific) n=1 Tax=Seminibacterium arietis TaxID=1173502 RepID=A0ABW3I9A2_9PAST
MTTLKQWKQAPLPFTGQKRMFIKHIEPVLSEIITQDGNGWTIVDVFGGSGLLAHTAKRLKPQARVIFNDYDDYSERLKHIEDTNRLHWLLKTAIDDTPEDHKLTPTQKAKIVNIIENFDGFLDFNCLSSWLLYPPTKVNNAEQLTKKTFFNFFRKTPLPSCDDYLDGLEITKKDFKELMTQHQNQEKTLFLLDPPYLCTEQKSYKKENYFNLIDFLQLMDLITPPFILFNSTKSEILEYINYTKESRTPHYEALKNATITTVKATCGRSLPYQDNFIYSK